jgi:hypothetical protein
VERGGEVRAYTAFPVEGGPTVAHVNALMSRKYGWADGLIGVLFDRSDAVAIRLDPRATPLDEEHSTKRTVPIP